MVRALRALMAFKDFKDLKDFKGFEGHKEMRSNFGLGEGGDEKVRLWGAGLWYLGLGVSE